MNLRQALRLPVLTLGLALLIPVAPSHAQRPTSVIAGSVVDSTGGVLPGATVVLSGPALIVVDLTTTTDARGDFRFHGLEPGIYEVRAALDGFATVVRPTVHLPVGATIQLDFELQPQLTVTVSVMAESPTVDVVTSTSTVVYTQEVLQSVPNDRFFSTVFNFAPGVTSDSARGSSVRGNAYRLDGVDITDPVVGTPFVFFNFDNFEQIQVQTGSRDAEYGQATGAVLNLVTKSGGNQFAGTANLYFSHGRLNSTNGQAITERFPSLQSGRFLDLADAQGQLGGPVSRNRVWFFGSFRKTASAVSVPGFNDRLGDPIPREFDWDYTYGKISSQLNQNHRLIGALNVNGFGDNNRNASALRSAESTTIEDSGAWTTNLEWTGTFGPAVHAQIRYTGVDQHFDMRPKNDQPRCFNLNTSASTCSEGSVDLNRRDRQQVHGAVSFFRQWGGFHNLKVGGEYERSSNWRDFSINQGRWNNFVEDPFGNLVPYTVWTYKSAPVQEAIGRMSVFVQDGWTVGDRLTLNLGLRVDSGEGWLQEQRLADGSIQPEMRDVVAQTDVSPRLGVAFDPLGTGRSVVRASYARYVGALISTYFFQINQNALSGELHAHCLGPLAGFCRPGDGEYSSAIFSSFGPSTTRIDDDLALPKVDEFSVGYEREVLPATSLTITYTHKNELDLIEDVQVARVFIPRTVRFPGDTEYDARGNVVDTVAPTTFTIYDPDFRTNTQLVITNPDEATRQYRGLEFVLNKRLSDRWFGQGSFVISESKGLVGTLFFQSSGLTTLFDSPNGNLNANGKLDLDRTFMLKLFGGYELPFAITVSGYYRWLSGNPFSLTALFTQYDANGDGVNETALAGGSVLVYAEPRGVRTLDGLHLFDLGVEKTIQLGRNRLGLRLDTYNLFNIDTVTSKRTRTSSAGRFGEPLGFVGPRGVRLAARIAF